jgi:uncharacterized protein YegP (UPF0339 family)
MKQRGTMTVYRDATGQWRWQVKASNGRIIGASSEGYKRRGRAIDNLLSITGYVVRILDERRGDPIVRVFRRA